MNKIKKLNAKLQASKPGKRETILDEFAASCFSAGREYGYNQCLSAIDRMNVGRPNYEQWKDGHKK